MKAGGVSEYEQLDRYRCCQEIEFCMADYIFGHWKMACSFLILMASSWWQFKQALWERGDERDDLIQFHHVSIFGLEIA